ncbi:hypothetical protein WICPIJ_000312 [Wickerhamomyces pijperi]|uniref:Enoyl reductase (ER) domain-containing protein n=1 Tax=Wickerhamomyces pijperi TaxID=599730 RepID=A0A9P8QCW6_WICPI|nr:hypothetical protein WICPIJ_000312 [Wickerhamomyces pijperi]
MPEPATSNQDQETMRGIIFYGAKDLRFSETIVAPKIEHSSDVIVDVHYCGICGTDLKEYTDPNFFNSDVDQPNKLTGLTPPLCMGHEIAGIVTEIGEGVQSIKIGDHVVIDPSVHCADIERFPNSPLQENHKCLQCKRGLTNTCDYSSLCGLGAQHGGLAEKFVCAERHVVVVPNSIPLEIAALTQPMAVSYHAVRIAQFKPGKSALILGCGAIGLVAILCCYGFKASSVVVSEPSKIRRENAERLGATTFDPSIYKGMENEDDIVIEELRKLSPNNEGFDYTFDCSGFETTFKAAVEACASNGTIVNVAIWGKKPINFWPMSITKHEKTLMGSMCYTREDFEGVLKCFEEGSIDINLTRNLITTVVSLENGIKGGFEHLYKNKKTEIKVLITPNNHGEIEHAKTYTSVWED